jgi:hypothetical protein
VYNKNVTKKEISKEKRMRSSWRISQLTIIVFFLFLILILSSLPASARTDGPECPPGFHFERLSGVGCVQTNCLSVPNAKYNAGQRCICADNHHACSVPVDSSGLDCGPFCPPVLLVACVPADQPCPGSGPGSGPSADGGSTIEDFLDFLTGSDGSTSDQGGEMSSLVQDLEDFLAGENRSSPSQIATAAGAASVTALLTAWVISQLLAGRPSADVIGAVSRWRQKSAGEPKVDNGGNGKPDQLDAEPDKDKPEQKKVLPSSEKAKPEKPTESTQSKAPDPPPDLPTLKRKYLNEKLEAQKQIDFITQLRAMLDQEYRRLYTDWEVARRCAPVDGVIDIADIWLSLRGKLTTSTVRGAYGKDLLKSSIKALFRKFVRYRQDGSFELSGGQLLEGAKKSLGVGGKPGAAFQQLLQNLASGKGAAGYGKFSDAFFKSYGKKLGNYYGTKWNIQSLVANTRKDMDTCQDLRSRMTALRDLFNQTSRDLETAQTNLDLAKSSLKNVEGDMKELKDAFPNKFSDL